MEEAETYVGEIYSAASRSFEEARKLVNQVKQARGYFPVVGVGIYDDGLSSLPGNRAPVARGRAPRSKGGGKGGRTAGPGTAGKGSLGITSRAPQQPAAKL